MEEGEAKRDTENHQLEPYAQKLCLSHLHAFHWPLQVSQLLSGLIGRDSNTEEGEAEIPIMERASLLQHREHGRMPDSGHRDISG